MPRPLQRLAVLACALLLAGGLASANPLRAQEPAQEAATEPVPQPAAPVAEAAAPTVASIEIRSDGPLPKGQSVEDLLSIAVGQPLTDQAVRRTLTNLYASGIAREVELYTRPAETGDGVVAVVVLWANVTVAKVRVEGNLGLKRRELLTRVVSGEGQPLVESRVLRGVYDLKDFYRLRGYEEANVRVQVEYPDPSATAAEVVYRIESGPPATFGEIGFEGDLGPFTAEELRKRSGLSPGQGYRKPRVDTAVERLEAFLLKAGHRLARIDTPQETYDPDTHTMAVRFHVEVGPVVDFEIVGANEKELRRKGLLPFLGREGYDEGLMVQAIQRIEGYYQTKGFYRVQVTSQESHDNGQLKLTLTVVPGREFTLEEVKFTGNRQVSTATLESLITTSPKKVLRLGSGRLVDSVLSADLSNLRSYYILQGFADAKVGPPEVSEDGDKLKVTIKIVEGQRREVASLRFEGIEALGSDELTEIVGERELRKTLENQKLLVEGGPFHPILLDDSVALIRARFQERGFAEVQVSGETHELEPASPEPTTEGPALQIAGATIASAPAPEEAVPPPPLGVAVVIKVLTGPQTLVDRVIVRGNRKTRTSVIQRTVDLDPGTYVSPARLLQAQRNLYRLGIFSRAEVTLGPTDLGGQTRDVLVRIDEGRTKRLVYGIGYDTEDGPRGLLGVSSSNLGGRAFTLGTDLRLSEKTQSFRLTFDQPYTGRLDIPLTYTLFYLDEERDNRDVRRWGGRIEAVKEFNGNDRWGLIYDYRIVRPKVDLGATGEELERQDREIRISSVIPNLFLDDRDDPIDPHHGWSSLVQLQYAFPFLSTTEEFVKLFVQQTQYVPLGLGGRGVLAASLRVGGIEPLRTAGDDPLVPAGQRNARVSIAERFFAGGLSTHRAYERDTLAIRDETSIPVSRDGSIRYEPIGGNGLLLLNVDYRFPIVGAFGGVVFFDAGNIWADWRDIDFRDAKMGVGAGVRYISPIGPIRFEVGYKLDREEGESTYEFHLSVGNPF